MDNKKSLNHTVWDCKYHIVWIPKYLRKVLYGQLGKSLGEAIRDLAQQKERKVWGGHLMSDHVHILMSILPQYAVAQAVKLMDKKGVRLGHVTRDGILDRGRSKVACFNPEDTDGILIEFVEPKE